MTPSNPHPTARRDGLAAKLADEMEAEAKAIEDTFPKIQHGKTIDRGKVRMQTLRDWAPRVRALEATQRDIKEVDETRIQEWKNMIDQSVRRYNSNQSSSAFDRMKDELLAIVIVAARNSDRDIKAKVSAEPCGCVVKTWRTTDLSECKHGHTEPV